MQTMFFGLLPKAGACVDSFLDKIKSDYGCHYVLMTTKLWQKLEILNLVKHY